MSRRPKQRIEIEGLSFCPGSFWTRVTKTEDCWVWEGGKNAKGYGAVNAIRDGRRTIVGAHRLSYLIHLGPIGEGMEVDHRCHVRACVNPRHLRLVTHKQNLENRAGLSSSNKSGFRGVRWNARHGKWHATIGHKNGKVHVGHFATAEAANEAVTKARLELFTHNDADRSAA